MESGGFAPDTAEAGFGAKKSDGPSLPFETLLSPVIADDMNDELDDTLNSMSVHLGFEVKILGLVKSSVTLCGWDCTKLDSWALIRAGGKIAGEATGAGTKPKVCEGGNGREADEEVEG